VDLAVLVLLIQGEVAALAGVVVQPQVLTVGLEIPRQQVQAKAVMAAEELITQDRFMALAAAVALVQWALLALDLWLEMAATGLHHQLPDHL
jgi:hypothetical protein